MTYPTCPCRQILRYTLVSLLIATGVALALSLLCNPCSGGDAAARLDALKHPQVKWVKEMGAPSPPTDKIFLVTESWCGPCRSLKAALKAEGIPYEAISMAEMTTRFNRTVGSIPYMFYIQRDGNRVGSYGSKTREQLRDWTKGLQLHATASSAPARSTCHISGQRTSESILRALVTHLAVESGADLPMGGLADIRVPLNTKISDLLVLLSHKQQLSLGRFVTANWQGLSVTSSKGRTVFNSPVVIEGRALGISLSATLKELYLHPDGRTLDIVVDGLPDLRVVFN